MKKKSETNRRKVKKSAREMKKEKVSVNVIVVVGKK